MIPNYGSAGAIGTSTGTASVNIPYPATVNTNDFLIMAVLVNNGNGINTPSGWSLLSSQSYSTTVSIHWFAMRAGGSESGNVSVTQSSGTSDMAGQMFRYTDVKTSGNPTEAVSSSSIASASTYTVPTCTTLGVERLQIAIPVVLTTATLQAPSSWTEDADNTSSGATFGAMSIDRPLALGYSSITGNISTTAFSTCLTLALIPASTYVTVNQATCNIAVTGDAAVENLMKVEQATCDIAVTLDAVMGNLATVNQATCDIQFSMDAYVLNLMIIEQATCDIAVTGTAAMLNLMIVNQASCDIILRCAAEMTANKEPWTQIERFDSLITIEINV